MHTTGTIIDAVRASGSFGASNRRYALLKYLLDEQYAGRGDRVKAYAIALDVFARSDDFDTSIDSIVRVEMHRLRTALKRFNETAEDFTITIPASSYEVIIAPVSQTTSIIPPAYKKSIIGIGLGLMLLSLCIGAIMFQKHITRVQENARYICSTIKPNVHLRPSVVIGKKVLNQDDLHIIDRHLRTGLSQYPAINLIGNKVNCGQSGTPSYSLSMTIFETAEHPFLSLQVQHDLSHNILYAKDIQIASQDNPLGEDTRWKIYTALSKLAFANGVILNDAVKRDWALDVNKKDFQCFEHALKHYEFFTEDEYQHALTCLQTAIDRDTKIPEIYAILSTFYFQQSINFREKIVANPLEMAESLLNTVEQFAPQNSEVLATRLRTQNIRKNNSVQDLRFYIKLLERQTPYHPHMLIFISRTYGYNMGDWEAAKRVSNIMRKIDDTHFFITYYVEFSYAFLHESADKAYNIAIEMYHPTSITSGLKGLAAANKAGETAQAQQFKEDLKALGLSSISDYVGVISSRQYEPKLTAELIKWLSVK